MKRLLTAGISLRDRGTHAGPLNLLLFSNSRVRGGVEEHMLTLLRGLDRDRFRLHLVCSPEVARHLEGDVPEDVTLVPLFVQGPRDVGAAWRLFRFLRTRPIHILHSHQFRASLVASPLGRLAGVPVVIETPHIREHWRRRGLKGSFLVDRMVGKLIDGFVAVSEANARYLIDRKGMPPGKVAVILNGCDLEKYRPSPERVAELRGRVGLDGAAGVLITIGRLEPQKGHGVLLDAMPALLRRYPGLQLVCLGEGSLRAQLEQQASRLGIERAIHFVGFQSDVASWLAMADVMVLASFYEGLPLVAVEALAAGCAVVATAVDGTPEVIRDGVTGLTVPPGDPAALAEAIARVLGDPELRERLARQGQEWVGARFDHERQVRETAHLYLRSWRERRGGAPVPGPARAAALTGDRGVR